MELVTFVAQNAGVGIFGGMGLATLSVFMPRLFARRFSSRSAIPVDVRLHIQEQLNDYESMLRKACDQYEFLKTNLTLAYPDTSFSTLKLSTNLEVLQETHKSHVVYVVKNLFASNLKPNEQEAAIKEIHAILSEKTEIASRALKEVAKKQQVLDSQASARNKMTANLTQMMKDIVDVKTSLPSLAEKYDSFYLMSLPESIYDIEQTVQKAIDTFDDTKNKFFNSANEIREANTVFETAQEGYKWLMDKMETLNNFQLVAMKETQPLKKVVLLKEVATPADLRLREAALEAIYKAQIHTYDSGHPQKVMQSILRPVYEYLEA